MLSIIRTCVLKLVLTLVVWLCVTIGCCSQASASNRSEEASSLPPWNRSSSVRASAAQLILSHGCFAFAINSTVRL